MISSKRATVQTVLILHADRFCAELLRQRIVGILPAAQIVVTSAVETARVTLSVIACDLVVADADGALDADIIDLLSQRADSSGQAVASLVLTARRELRVLTALRALDVAGVYDSAHEEIENFAVALHTVAQGCRYWSPSLLQYFQRGGDATAFLHILTAFEELVLAVVGDGCDDSTAAQHLNVSPATIATVRRDLHRKLGVQHRGELVRIAAQHGFVRFTPTGVLRPGFATLFAAYQSRRSRRAEPVSPTFPEAALPAA